MKHACIARYAAEYPVGPLCRVPGVARSGFYAAHRRAASMTCTGDCRDNAVAESFFWTLKTELVHEADWPTRAAARAAVFEYLEVWYNRPPRHSAFGYLSPVEYEARQAA